MKLSIDNTDKKRRRGISLSPEGISRVEKSLLLADDSLTKERMTWSKRASLMGVSVSTAKRMLEGKPVDRFTIESSLTLLGVEVTPDLFVSRSLHVDHNTQLGVSGSKSSPPRVVFALLVVVVLSLVSLIANNSFLQMRESQASAARENWLDIFTRMLAAGSADYHAGQYERAKFEIEAAIKLARDNNCPANRLASAIRMAGDISSAKGNLAGARECYVQALALQKSIGQATQYPAINLALGDLSIKTGDLADSRSAYESAFSGFTLFRDKKGQAFALQGLATVCQLQGNPAKSFELCQRAAVLLRAFPEDIDSGMALQGQKALALSDLGRIDEAKDMLLKCLDHWTAKGHRRWMADVHMKLAHVEIKNGSKQAATAFLRLSSRDYLAVGDRYGTASSLKLIQKIRP